MTGRAKFDERVRISEQVVFEKIEEEMVLLNLQNGVYYGLDPVGSRVWELLSASGSPVAVLEQMQMEYDVPPETLHGDMKRLLRELTEQGLIVLETCP